MRHGDPLSPLLCVVDAGLMYRTKQSEKQEKVIFNARRWMICQIDFQHIR